MDTDLFINVFIYLDDMIPLAHEDYINMNSLPKKLCNQLIQTDRFLIAVIRANVNTDMLVSVSNATDTFQLIVAHQR